MLKSLSKLSIIALTTIAVVSCGSDDDNNSYNVPNSYNFSNVSYSGQISRIDMLKEMTSYMKTAHDGVAIDAQQLKNMYANTNYTWTSSPFTVDQPTKQLKNKTATGESISVENWMDKLAVISASSTTGSNGTAGLVTSLSGSKKYIFDENGFEPIQLIDKGLMGSVFYYQGTSVYLSDSKVGGANNDDLAENKTYTDMQHYWDEAFGYGSFPIDLTGANIGTKNSAGELSYYSKYLKKAHDANLNTVDQLMKDGFISGRAAINNKDYNTRDEAIILVRKHWEMINVAAALHYLNASLTNLGDDALRNHELSEAYAFINAIKFNEGRTMTIAEVDATLDALGTNFYTITATQINNAKSMLASKFEVTANDF